MLLFAAMKVKIKRIDNDLPLPRYETDGSVGFDILARVETKIAPKQVALIPGNIIVEVPEGYMLTVASRSSTPIKKGLLTPHGIGIIDRDYCGQQDEIKIQVYNFSDGEVVIGRGDKIAQGLFVRVDTFAWEEVGEMKKVSRGGFGSTDKAEPGSQVPERNRVTDRSHESIKTNANERGVHNDIRSK
jgi:dUTP pyrophosphatase